MIYALVAYVTNHVAHKLTAAAVHPCGALAENLRSEVRSSNEDGAGVFKFRDTFDEFL